MSLSQPQWGYDWQHKVQDEACHSAQAIAAGPVLLIIFNGQDEQMQVCQWYKIARSS